jgi:hypothetical protein
MAQSQSLIEVKWRAMICPSWQSNSKMINQSKPRRWPIEVYINQQIKKGHTEDIKKERQEEAVPTQSTQHP